MSQAERPIAVKAGEKLMQKGTGGCLFLALGVSALAVARDPAWAALILQIEQEIFKTIQDIPPRRWE